MVNHVKVITKNREALPIDRLKCIYFFLFFLTSCMHTNSFCASSLEKLTEPFYETSWAIEDNICTVYFYVPNELESKKSAIGEFIHRSMIDDHTRKRGIQSWMNDPLQVRDSFSEAHCPPNEDDSKYTAFVEKLRRLSGISYEEKVKNSPNNVPQFIVKLKRDKKEPDEFDRALFRQTVCPDQLGLSLSESERKLYFSLALARALLHNEYYQAIYYLLAECDPNADLTGYIDVRFDKVIGIGKEWILGSTKSVPTLLHACMLNPHLIHIHYGMGDAFEKIPTRASIKIKHEINALLEAGANPDVLDSGGIRPIDILKARFACLQKNPRFATLDFSAERDKDLLRRLEGVRADSA